MNHNYRSVIASLLFPILGISTVSAQPQFLQCSSEPNSLCIRDEGVRLPANNQLYLGEENPDATSCSVHVTQKKLVQTTCGGPLQYEVQLFIEDTSTAYIVKPLTIITPDSNGIVELYFDTEESTDALISESGIPYTKGCANYHRIKWIVTDSCGEESVCDELIDVYDCSIPAAENPASSFVVNIPNGCQLTLYAEDFYLGGVDDCSLQDQLTFSFEEEKYNPYITVTCPEAIGVELTWKIWIADEGRDLNCDGQIDWSEKNRIEHPFQIRFSVPGHCECGMPPDPMLTGEILTIQKHEGINQVSVSLLRTGTFFPTYVTGPDGKYSFNLSLSNQETTIKPEKNDGHKNGVSTLDLIKIQKHLLGIELFNEPYQFIAADANNSQNVSAIDLIELRKLILGIYTELPSNMSWRFVVREYVFPDTMGTWTYASTITFTDMLPDKADFYGIKIGDVNGSVQPHFTDVKPRGDLTPFNLLTDQLEYKGEVIQVPIRVASSEALTGFQYTLNTPGMEILDVVSDRIPLAEGDYALFGDKMTISWFNENNVDVSEGDVLFTLVLKAKQDGNVRQSLSINSDITDAEIYLDGDKTFLPVLNVMKPISGSEFEMLSCAPNPWKEETTLSFYLPEANNVTYSLMDVNGRKVFSDNDFLKEGYHSYILKATNFSARGMLFLEIHAGGNSLVQKMVMME